MWPIVYSDMTLFVVVVVVKLSLFFVVVIVKLSLFVVVVVVKLSLFVVVVVKLSLCGVVLCCVQESSPDFLLHSAHTNRFVRALHYRYRFTKLGSPEASQGQWWSRERIGQYLPIVSTHQLRPVIESQDWRWYSEGEGREGG